MKPIDTEAELGALADRLRAEPLLAVDTEAASFHRYLDRIYLLQISSREETAVVDPLATGGLGPIGELLADPVVALVRRGRLAREATVTLPGGELHIRWPSDGAEVIMAGPAAFVFEGEWQE